MKKITFILLILLTGTAFGQESANATVTADIVSPISITAGNGLLNFGKLLQSTGGTVTISPDGSRTGTAEMIVVSSAFSAATFSMKAENSYNFSVTIPDIVLTNGTDNLEVNNFTHNLPSLQGTGIEVPFSVGGTLNVEATDSNGAYTGTATVTVAYQ